MSAQIIAFTKRLDFKTLLDIECKGITGFAPVVKDSIDDFQSMLSLLPNIDVVVVDEYKGEADYKQLLDSISQKSDSIKNIIFLGNYSSGIRNSKNFPEENIIGLVDHLKSLLGTGPGQSTGYISVPADSLIHFKMLPFDLYIKISGDKFIKRIPANEDIDESTVDNFKAKGITDLYFEKKYNRDFSLMLLNNMINKVERDYSCVNEKLKATNEVFVTTKEIVRSAGLPPRVIEVCESVMESITVDVMKSKDKLGSYLSQLKHSSELNFQFRFVELTSFIATQIVDQMNRGTKEEDIRKIVFASFFCDISLLESSHLDYRSEQSVADLFHEDKKSIREHALKSSSIAAKYKNAPADADVIIKQHHGSPDGIGFPAISMGILPLSKCLIAAQELAYAILKEPDKSPESIVNKVTQANAGTPIYEYLAIFENSCKGNL